MTREEMLTLIIQKFGFEHEYTIQFAEAMEWMGLAELEALTYEVLALPLSSDKDLD